MMPALEKRVKKPDVNTGRKMFRKIRPDMAAGAEYTKTPAPYGAGVISLRFG